MDVNGTAAIVSGGASGLGEAAARALAAAGARVVIADLNEAGGKQVASEIGGLFAHTDVVDEASVQAAVDAAAGTGAPLRVAVSCAGIAMAARTVGRDGSPHDLATYQRVININLIGTFNLMRIAAVPFTSMPGAYPARPRAPTLSGAIFPGRGGHWHGPGPGQMAGTMSSPGSPGSIGNSPGSGPGSAL
jgi:NAD(P)-dependent dehydrogenase (short-subunit alcohol dehydrogenase family)